MEMIRIISIGLLFVFMQSCMQEEIPVPIPPPGEVKTNQIAMTSNYLYQIYFNLESGKNVSDNSKTEWDLGFECGEFGSHVILNSSKLMFATATGISDFKLITDTANGYNWKIDAASGNMDSTAIGEWMTEKSIYIIDRGADEKGRHQGFYKIMLESYDEVSFTFNYAELSEENPIQITMPKDNLLNFNFFSFSNGGEIKPLEPAKTEWDILFTQYSDLIYDKDILVPYLVTGVQINRFNTIAALDESRSFDEIDLETVLQYEFSKNINQPGYLWKEYNFDESVYTVFTEKTYIIKSQMGNFYKLRFIDFYSEEGERGYPKFEYQRL